MSHSCSVTYFTLFWLEWRGSLERRNKINGRKNESLCMGKIRDKMTESAVPMLAVRHSTRP